MTEQEILSAVQDVFRDNFDDDTLEITRTTCADDIEDWDTCPPMKMDTNLLFRQSGAALCRLFSDFYVKRMYPYEPLHLG